MGERERATTDRCPVCDTAMVPIAYGYPTGATFAAAERGDVVLGGCLVRAGQPQWQCPQCRHAADRTHDEAPF